MEDSGRREKRKREQNCTFRERFFSKDLQYIFQGLWQNRSVRLLDQNPAERWSIMFSFWILCPPHPHPQQVLILKCFKMNRKISKIIECLHPCIYFPRIANILLRYLDAFDSISKWLGECHLMTCSFRHRSTEREDRSFNRLEVMLTLTEGVHTDPQVLATLPTAGFCAMPELGKARQAFSHSTGLFDLQIKS